MIRAARETERAILARLGARENGQVHAWVLHAVGQMRTARAVKARGGSAVVVSDCVACARACRRTAREIRNGGGS